MNDWTLIESAWVIICVFAIPALIGVVIGIWEALKWIWGAIRKELDYRYYFRAVRDPYYDRINTAKKERRWKIIRKIFRF